jgi:quercetin dioxygenase-like cupin family protein
VFAYILRGEIENQVDPGEPRNYSAGEVFYEAPMHAHRVLRNQSTTETAEVLIFQAAEKGQPASVAVEK